MTETVPPSRAARVAPFVTGLAIALPQVAFGYPAMTDLPHHEGLVAILRHMHDPTFFPPGLYVYNFGHANQLFYFLAWGLSYLVGVPFACKLVVAATLFAIPVAGARLADHLGTSRWASLLLAPVALGWLYYWGLIANLMGIAALLALLPTLDRLAEAPSPRRALAGAAGALLMYECHELMLIAYAGAALIFAAGHELRARPTALRLTPFATAGALTLVERVIGAIHQSATNHRVATLWSPFVRKLYTIPGALFGGVEPLSLYTTTGISLLALGLLVSTRVRAAEDDRGAPRARGVRAILHDYRFELFGASCFALYLALPCNVLGATLVYHRYLAPAYAVLLLCASSRGAHARLPRIAPLVLAGVPLAALMTLLPIIADESADAADVEKLFTRMQKSSAFAVSQFGPPSSASRRVTSVSSIGDRALTFVGGRVLFGFAESAVSPVQYAPGYEWDDPIRRTMFDAFAFRPAYDFTRFRYMLMCSASAPAITGLAVAISPDARLVDTAGSWALFESKLPTVPLLSPDGALPTPHPETMRAMFKRFVQSRDTPLSPTDLPAEPDPKRIDDGLTAPATP